MKNKTILALFGLVLALGLAPSVRAAQSPLSISIFPPAQFPPSDFSVTGLRTSVLWGNHKNVYGIDLGLLGNVTQGQMTGIGVSGLFNLNKGQTTGVLLQAAGVGNFNVQKARIYGVQIAGLVNSNHAESMVGGLMIAPVNLGKFTKVRGAQLGLYNVAHHVAGLQIGLVNVTDSLTGLQIGLINFHKKGLFSVAPILNMGF